MLFVMKLIITFLDEDGEAEVDGLESCVWALDRVQELLGLEVPVHDPWAWHARTTSATVLAAAEVRSVYLPRVGTRRRRAGGGRSGRGGAGPGSVEPAEAQEAGPATDPVVGGPAAAGSGYNNTGMFYEINCILMVCY